MKRRPLLESAIDQIEIISRPARFSKKPLFKIFRGAIRRALRTLPLPAVKIPKKFLIFADQEEISHFQTYDDDGYVDRGADGQVEKDNMTISLRSSFYREHCRSRGYLYEVILHEIAHVYHFYLRGRGINVNRDWRKVTGNVYNYKKYGKKYRLGKKTVWRNQYPADGLISEYSTTNIQEDIADFFAEIYVWLCGYASAFDRPNFLIVDDRYIKKIKLFYKYKFITSETYHKLIRLHAKVMRQQIT